MKTGKRCHLAGYSFVGTGWSVFHQTQLGPTQPSAGHLVHSRVQCPSVDYIPVQAGLGQFVSGQ